MLYLEGHIYKEIPTNFIKPWMLSYLDIGPFDKRSEFDLFTLHSLGLPVCKMVLMYYFFEKTVLPYFLFL